MLLDFLNLGGAELGIIAVIVLAPLILIIYSIVDILRSSFKTAPMKWIFLLLVLFAPFLGSIIYLVIRKDYVKPKDFNSPFV